VEDDLVTTAGGDDFPVATAQGPIGPPAILDQPRLSHAVHGSAVDEQRPTVVVGANGDAAGYGEATRPAHRIGSISIFTLFV
jgi:hypothetical protein